MARALNHEQILNDLAVGMMIVDTDWRVSFFNSEAERITGTARALALGRPCHEVFQSPLCAERCYLREALAKERRVVRVRTRIATRTQKQIPVEVRCMVLRDQAGQVMGGLESFLDDSARTALEARLKQSHTLGDFIGADARITKLFETLPVIAESDAAILVLGETGAGKDLLARVIHNISRRRNGPFVKVNCAALPPSLLESELFGYKKGAFTDAKSDKLGRFEMAEGGTILLDEIGELPRELQAKLLQVLDEQEFYPLGATRPIRVNVRVIASTNRDLGAMVMDRSFRRDLYYRLKVVEVLLPALRDRPADIPLLIDHFVSEWAVRLGKEVPAVDPAAMQVLLEYAYPGNVRELRHIIEHAVLLARDGVVHRDGLPHYIVESAAITAKRASATIQEGGSLARPSTGAAEAPPASPTRASAAAAVPARGGGSAAETLRLREREGLLEVLTSHRWRIGDTAEALGITRSTLWRKLKKHGIATGRRTRRKTKGGARQRKR